MSAPFIDARLAGVQTLPALGYRLRCCRHLLLRIDDPTAARAFLAQLLARGWLRTLAAGPAAADADADADGAAGRGCALDIGFGHAGLAALGLPDRLLGLLRERAPAFVQGAAQRAAERLGDTGPSAAERWDARFAPAAAHVLLTLHADAEPAIDARSRELRNAAAGAFSGWDAPLDGRHLGAPGAGVTVHFGYRDGIGRVAVRGIGGRGIEHAAGEVFLGHDNDAGFDRWQGLAPEAEAFFRNGSFGALRQMQQDEAAFRRCVQRWAAELGSSREYVMAKLCGRWPDGAPVTASQTRSTLPDALPPAQLDIADFAGDAKGHGCPFGSHLRRMNPRGDPVLPSRRRPLVRRGMPYGPPYADAPEQTRGLLGLFFCASLEDQFEHLLGHWADGVPLGSPDRGKAKDPLIGNHEDPAARFEIPMASGDARHLGGFEAFVVTRGTAYAFYPGRSGIEMLARGPGAR